MRQTSPVQARPNGWRQFLCLGWRFPEAALPVHFTNPTAAQHRIFTTLVANVYPFYIAKAEKKGRTKVEVDTIFCWLTGYTPKQLEKQLKQETDFETFFAKAPKMNPARKTITGVICGVRVEDIEDPLMREIPCRWLPPKKINV